MLSVRVTSGLCVLRMLKIFPGGREQEVEGDGIRKGETKKESDLFKKAQKMEEAGVVPM